MSDGNEIEIRVTSKDDADLDKLGPKYKKQGEQLGKQLGEGFEKSTKSQKRTILPVAAENPIDAAWRAKVQSSLKDTAKTALNIPLTPETEGFHRELSRLLEQTSHTARAEIPMDLKDAAAFKAQVETLARALSEEVKVRVPVEVDKPSLKKTSDDVKKATEKVAERTQQQFEALKFTALSAGLPLAATVGALGVTAALAAVPALFIGLGAASLKGNGQVADSFGNLKEHVVSDTQEMAGVLAGPASQAATQLGASFDRLKPQIQTAMNDSDDAVETLVGTVTDFAENAMPGLVTAVKTSEPVLKGLRTFAGQAGAGVTDLFTNVAKGSKAAGQSMETFGGITRDFEGFIGSFLANLANGSTSVLPQFAGTLHQAEDVVLSLSSKGMPALQGATSGALGVIGGGLSIVSAFASGLGSWTQPLGQTAGTLYATNSMLKLFGTSMGETGFGVGAFAKTVQDGEQRISPFKAALADAEKNGTSKLKAGANALVSNGINPLGLALVGGGLLLSAWGDYQQKAAQKVAEHKENVRSLTDALRADNGVIGEHSAAVNVDALQSKNAAANVSVFGSTLEVAKLAIAGNAGAMKSLTDKSNDFITSLGQSQGLSATQVKGLRDVRDQMLQNGGTFDDVAQRVNGLTTANQNLGKGGSQAVSMLTATQQDLVKAMFNGTGAIGEQVKAQQEAHDAYVISEHALSGLSAAQIENRDATIKATQAIYDQQNANLGLRGAQLNSKAAIEDYAKTLKDGKASDDDKAMSLLKVEQAFANEEAAAYKAAYANSTATTESGKLAEANRAADARTVQLANTFNGALPASLQQTIGKMSVTQAQAAGLTVAVNNTGQAVYRLPNGKEIVITGNTQAARDAINGFVRDNNGRVVSINVVTYYTSHGTPGVRTGNNSPDSYYTGPHAASGGLFTGGGVQRFAKGGQAYATASFAGGGGALDVGPGGLLHGPGTGTSDSILARVGNGEFVVKASQTAKHLPLLKAINNGTEGFSGGGLVDAAREMLGQLNSGGQFFEDFSFYGNSDTVRNHNDELQELFGKSRAPGWDFDGSGAGAERTASDISSWLSSYIGQQTAAPAASSGSGWHTVKAGNPAGGAGGGTVVLEVRSSGNPLDDFMAEMIRRYVRVQGGNVQAVFGQ